MDELLNWLQHDSWMTRISSFLLMAMLAFLPAIPIPLVAGIIAATYSVPVALFISLGGTIFGSICMFYLCRYGFQMVALKQVQKWQRLDGFFQLLERNGFLAVLIGRLVPIMPSAAINAIAGVTKVRFSSFLLATALGKFPTMLAFTLAGAQFGKNQLLTGTMIGLYVLVIFLIGLKIRNKWARG
ncbi:TVP38/TMEM64 family protein [Lysinibacillus sp. NPDC097287]|uniref:TVP38/TMEM64 family protein n=1 Tax=Lysinibacillus sp. NPDC097287 TaxID=3364144 RepID=UPI00380A7AF4